MNDTKPPAHILPVIVFSQFAGTSLWFAGNAILDALRLDWSLPDGAVGVSTSAVQFGFITGALTFAFFAVADRISPRLVFFACALAGALANLGMFVVPPSLTALLVLRFVTGFFLAGIYPVGMKIAASWYAGGLGRAIGWLVAALVLGTAFPHLIKGLGQSLGWQIVTISVSGVAALGGLLLFATVPDGPHLPRKPVPFDPRALHGLFKTPDFRAASFGYFGHMWELYAYWALLPVFLSAYVARTGWALNISLASFALIAIGFFGCVVGGRYSQTHGSARVAGVQIATSGFCCLASPLFFLYAPPFFFLAFLVLWGMTVIGDSPQFSALTAQTAPRDRVGSALTIVNCIGFSITIFSIQLLDWLSRSWDVALMFLALAPGPLLGWLAVRPLKRTAPG